MGDFVADSVTPALLVRGTFYPEAPCALAVRCVLKTVPDRSQLVTELAAFRMVHARLERDREHGRARLFLQCLAVVKVTSLLLPLCPMGTVARAHLDRWSWAAVLLHVAAATQELTSIGLTHFDLHDRNVLLVWQRSGQRVTIDGSEHSSTVECGIRVTDWGCAYSASDGGPRATAVTAGHNARLGLTTSPAPQYDLNLFLACASQRVPRELLRATSLCYIEDNPSNGTFGRLTSPNPRCTPSAVADELVLARLVTRHGG